MGGGTLSGVVAMASSAGGYSALAAILSSVSPDLAVPILIVQHVDPHRDSVLAPLLQRTSVLPVSFAVDGETAKPHTAYVAPPNHHLTMRRSGVLVLDDGPFVNFVRPSADVLFSSVAASYGDRALACVLTGTGADGAAGVEAVHARGGTVIVEDPATALFSGMPRAAVATGAADFVVPLDHIPGLIEELVSRRAA